VKYEHIYLNIYYCCPIKLDNNKNSVLDC
jgi:hypothetical protein